MKAGRPSHFAEVTRRRALEALGLDVSYERGEGSRLWPKGAPDDPVWDFLGGYGSTFFGHNHAELLGVVTTFMEQRRVVLAQASVRPASERLRATLSHRLRAALGGSYEILLSNTGSEAVEAAARHAEEVLDRSRSRLSDDLARLTHAARGSDWTPGTPDTLERHGIPLEGDVAKAVEAHNIRKLDAPASHVALERSYHGTTARARSLTHDSAQRFRGGPAAPEVCFVDAADPDSVQRAVDASTVTLLRPRRRGAAWSLEELAWAPIASLFVEPIRGEGGIHPLLPEVVSAWRATCDRHGIPLVADEIQCGMGRTGTFLYCEQLGVRPDYLLMGKSLGGGIAKVSAIAIDSGHFLPGFSLRNASTFAGDDLSSAVAARALEILDEECALEKAASAGRQTLERLGSLASRFPDVVRDVRGSGLMIGIEWREPELDGSNLISTLHEYGWLGYALSSFLLHEHHIRVAPTLGGHLTTRIEPPYGVPATAIDLLLDGLEDVCDLLLTRDSARLLAGCLNAPRPTPRERTPAGPVRSRPPADPHVGFVGHFIEAGDYALWDTDLGRLPEELLEEWMERIYPVVEPVVVHRDVASSATGQEVTLTFVGLAIPSKRFYDALRSPERKRLRALVQRAVDMAVAEGCSVVGLGGYCSILTRNGRDLRVEDAAITTGNGYTVGAGLRALRSAALEAGLDPSEEAVAVVGATGNIGTVVSHLMAGEAGSLLLLGRSSRLRDLEALAGSIREAYGGGCPVRVSSNLDDLREARIIASASNQPGPLLLPSHLSESPIVVADFSVPADVHPAVAAERPLARVIRGGIVRTPANPQWRVPGIPLEPGEMFACMTETVLMGLEGHTEHGSYGALSAERVRETLEMAERHGFDTVRTTVASSY